MSGGGVPARTQGARETQVSPRYASRRTTPRSMHATAMTPPLRLSFPQPQQQPLPLPLPRPRRLRRLQVADGHCKRHQHRHRMSPDLRVAVPVRMLCHLVDALPRSARRDSLAAGEPTRASQSRPEGTAVEAGGDDPHPLTAAEHAGRISAVPQARASLGRPHESAASGTQRHPHGPTE